MEDKEDKEETKILHRMQEHRKKLTKYYSHEVVQKILRELKKNDYKITDDTKFDIAIAKFYEADTKFDIAKKEFDKAIAELDKAEVAQTSYNRGGKRSKKHTKKHHKKRSKKRHRKKRRRTKKYLR